MELVLGFGQAYLPLFHLPDDHRVVLIEGNRGSSKTRSILSFIMVQAMKYDGSRWALWRSTRTRLSETVLKTLEDEVFPAFGMTVPGKAGSVNRSHYELPNGSSLIPIGLDDIYRATSAGFAGGYLNEGIEIPTLELVDSLTASLRQDVVPVNRMIIDTNPGPPGHWLNKKAEYVPDSLRAIPTCRAEYEALQRHNAAPAPDPLHRWKRIIAGHEDNPGYFDVSSWTFTKLGERYVKGTLEGLTGHLKTRWLHRRWVSGEGSVFPEFDPDTHVVSPFPIPEDWPWFAGFDPGYDHPCALLYFAVSPNDTVYIADEIYGSGIDLARLVSLIRAKPPRDIRGWYADPQEAFSTRQSSKSIASQLREMAGLKFHPWPRSTDKQAMVEAVRQQLLGRTMKVFSTCAETINEFQSWAYKRTASGEMPAGDDAYEDRNNHSMDVVAGMVATGAMRWRRGGVKVLGG